MQMIATMAVNMAKHDDDYKTTLVIVPAALLQQVSKLDGPEGAYLTNVYANSGKTKLNPRPTVSSVSMFIMGKIN